LAPFTEGIRSDIGAGGQLREGGPGNNAVDIAAAVPYNRTDMDSLNAFRIPAVALSSLLLWNWWAVPTAR
jgi:hypothetical protein